MVKKALESLVDYLDIQVPRSPDMRKFSVKLPHPKENGESLDITGFFQLDGYSCGAIAGWTIINAIHPGSVRFKEYYESFGPEIVNGTDDTKLLKSLRKCKIGYEKVIGQLTFNKIKRSITEGYPILSSSSLPDCEDDHWVVVYGYSEPIKNEKYVFLAGTNDFFGKMFYGVSNPIKFENWRTHLKGHNQYVCWGK